VSDIVKGIAGRIDTFFRTAEPRTGVEKRSVIGPVGQF
jgi:hypothetical protein